MKKRITLILGMVVVAIAANLYFANENNKSTLDSKEDYSFTIEDTASVQKIIIKDKRPTEVTLVRGKNHWVLNGKYKAREDAVEVLLQTLNQMTLKNFVESKSEDAVLKNMAVYGKEVVVYGENDEVIKHFFVGTNTANDMGTYMLMKGANKPYAVYIPGLNGYLSGRFFSDEHLWRDRTLFGVKAHDIKSVELTYTEKPEMSFLLEANEAGIADVKDYLGNITEVNPQRIAAFVQGISRVSYEGLIIESDEVWNKKDSISNSVPVFSLVLSKQNGETVELRGYHINAAEGELDINGDPLKWDTDRLYGIVSDGRFVLIQYFGMSKVLKTIDDLKDPTPII